MTELTLIIDYFAYNDHQFGQNPYVEIHAWYYKKEVTKGELDGNLPRTKMFRLKLYQGRDWWECINPKEYKDIHFKVILPDTLCGNGENCFYKAVHIGGSEFEYYRLPETYENFDLPMIAQEGNFGYFSTGSGPNNFIYGRRFSQEEYDEIKMRE